MLRLTLDQTDFSRDMALMTAVEITASADNQRNSLGFAKSASETRVAVAMSGGVDSSVVAAMVADEGFDTVGLTMQLYDHGAALAKKGASTPV